MVENETLQLFGEIKVWQSGDLRAPHKPLLLLYALGKLQRGQRWLLYEELHVDMSQLLDEFGSGYMARPAYPFQYLKNDGLWTYHPQEPAQFSNRLLREEGISGGFVTSVYKELRDNPELITLAALQLLNDHFPSSLHRDLLQAVNLQIETPPEKQAAEEPMVFCAEVLRVYDNRCALCGWDVKIGAQPLALEVAHIKWLQYGGKSN